MFSKNIENNYENLFDFNMVLETFCAHTIINI